MSEKVERAGKKAATDRRGLSGLYKFPPMLGPAEDWPEGTPDWAMRMGNRLCYQIRAAGKDGVQDLIPTVRKVMSVRPYPWEVWPDPPAGTPDAYFQLCAGKTYRQIRCLIDTYEPLALEAETSQTDGLEALRHAWKLATDSERRAFLEDSDVRFMIWHRQSFG